MRFEIHHCHDRSGGDYGVKDVILSHDDGTLILRKGMMFVLLHDEPEYITWKRLGREIERMIREAGLSALRSR